MEHNKYNKISNLSMQMTAERIMRNLFIYGDDFAFEKTKNYCFIYLTNWRIMVHKYDDIAEVLVIPDSDYELTTDDMIYFEKILRE